MVLCAVHAREAQARAPGIALGPAGPPQGTRTGEEGAQGRESGPKAAGASLGPERGRRSGTAVQRSWRQRAGGLAAWPHPPAMAGAPPWALQPLSSTSGTGLWQQWGTAVECLLFVT